MDGIDWQAAGAAAGLVSTFLALASFLFLGRQLREARKATIGQSFLGIVGIVQSEDMRQTRRRVFSLRSVPLESWSQDNIHDIEKVCQSYDLFGMLCRHGLIPTRMIVDSWGDSIMRSWLVCEPYIAQLRRDRSAPEFWDDFEWLYLKSKNSGRRRKKDRLLRQSS